jgi:hypothetical protein
LAGFFFAAGFLVAGCFAAGCFVAGFFAGFAACFAAGFLAGFAACVAVFPRSARPLSYRARNASTGTRRIASPITSSGSASSDLNRTHDFPMSSFLPAFANASRNHAASSGLP